MRRLLTVILSLCLILLSMAVLTPAIQSQGSTDSQNLLPNRVSGPSVGEFLTADGRFDLEAARASGYEGPLDLGGLGATFDPRTGEPHFGSSASEGGDDRGGAWSALGSGLDSRVYAFTIYDNKLIVGGDFTTAGGVGASRIAAWDGSSWSSLGLGLLGRVNALTVYNNNLIAGGVFSYSGDGGLVNHIASWNGSLWSPLGSGMNNNVLVLTVYDNQLIAGGDFTSAGGSAASHVASWDGSSWSPLGSGTNAMVDGLALYDNELIVGGIFSHAGDVVCNRVASWDGSVWSPLGSAPIYSLVLALTVYDD